MNILTTKNTVSQDTQGFEDSQAVSNIPAKLNNLSHLTAKRVQTTYTKYNFDDTVCEFWGDIEEVRNVTIDSISIDAEWFEKEIIIDGFEGDITSLLTTQITCTSEDETIYHVLIWDCNFSEPSNTWKSKFATANGALLFVKSSIGDDRKRIVNFLGVSQILGLPHTKEINVFMYYSPRDITATLMTREVFNTAVKSGDISKKRNINGKYTYEEYGVKLVFKDLIGAFNSSLDGAFDLVGLNNTTKGLIDKNLKSHMDEAIRQDPDIFATYAMGDTKDLFRLWELRVEQLNNVIENSLGFNPNFTTDNCPRTSGKLVSDTMCMWLNKNHPELMIAIEFLGHTPSNLKHKQNLFNRALVNQKDNILKTGKIELTKSKNKKSLFNSEDIRKKYFTSYGDKYGQSISGLARGSISALGALSNNFQSLNAIVNGGRCHNEHHREFQILDVFDIDMSSCYGTTLRYLDFPIGRPKNVVVTRKYKGKEKQITLKEVLKKYGDKFIDGLWQLVLESPKDDEGNPILLKFEQDLLYSKIGITPESVREDLKKDVNQSKWGDDEVQSLADTIDFAHIKGEFKLLRSEFKNVVLTAHSLKILESDATSQRERKQILNMNVVAGVYYDKHDEVTTEELFNILTDDSKRGGVETSKEDISFNVDNRTNKWARVKLDGFIGKFIDYRGELKKKKVSKGDKYDIEQTAVKLFINTLYGCLASPYFPISNAILANNITDKARCGVWMINKALGTVQSITDGGAYSNNGVRFLKTGLSIFNKEKPTLHNFSDYNRLNNNRCVKVDKLFDDFDGVYKKLKYGDKNQESDLDKVALDHVNNFWSSYNLELPFNVEHKYSNTCKNMVYGNSSDYLMLNPVKATLFAEIKNCEIKNIVNSNELDKLNKDNLIVPYSIKVRAAKQDNHVNKLWLFYLARLIKKPKPSYDYKQIIGIGQQREALLSSNQPEWSKYLVPGENLRRTTVHKPTTSKIQPFKNEVDFTLCKRRKSSRDMSYKKSFDEDTNLVYGLLNSLNEYFDEESKNTYYNFLRNGDDLAFENNRTGRNKTRKSRGKYKRN